MSDDCYIPLAEKKNFIKKTVIIVVILSVVFFFGGYGVRYLLEPEEEENNITRITFVFEDIGVTVYDNPIERHLLLQNDEEDFTITFSTITMYSILTSTIEAFDTYGFLNYSEAFNYFNVTGYDELIDTGIYIKNLTSLINENGTVPENHSMGIDTQSYSFGFENEAISIISMYFKVVNMTDSTILDALSFDFANLDVIKEYVINGTTTEKLFMEGTNHTITIRGFDYYTDTLSIGRLKYNLDGIARVIDI